MHSLWNDAEAAAFTGPLGPRIYSSRLLGREPALVLHGGGNTSVKLRERNLLGDEEDLLYVKGSGWDLERIEAGGFPAVRLEHLRRLAALETLSDPQMVNELRTHMTRASAPTPSVEAILHAVLPQAYVDHTHADAIITLCNSPGGEARVRALYGGRVVIIPYVMPGFLLAQKVAEEYPRQAHAGTEGMILLSHGVFSFGATARESYERMITLVTLAEEELQRQGAWELPPPLPAEAGPLWEQLAPLRQRLCAQAGRPMILVTDPSPRHLAFARRTDADALTQQGPATPDHVIRTKRLPLLGRDLDAYARDYAAYFAACQARAPQPLTMLDPAPRVLLDPEFGLATAGASAQDAHIVRDIYRRTLDIIERAALLGGWQALPPGDIFDVEYWDLEQAKLKSGGPAPLFAGEIAWVSGGAKGIGRACVEALLRRGAAVVALDLDPAVESLFQRPDYLGITCDLSDTAQIEAARERAVRAFGGLDMLLLNAGIFPKSAPIAALDDAAWRRVMAINLDANLALLRLAHPLLKCAPRQGRVAAIGSKNVPAPGPGAAAYSASKAALNQLLRVAALEWGADGIRINSLHPNMVFDTALWTDEILAARAAHYGLTVAQYKTNNVLRTEVRARDVAELAAELLGPLFAKTTGAQIPVDGGNERVI
jgi:rhamnose utilization protein RhaD (predicted bifunctional aldolase and dehydrogenase)/NAD(P)-dependent dehydrogenase (short-subunit alcohol dehydrogenase family)